MGRIQMDLENMEKLLITLLKHIHHPGTLDSTYSISHGTNDKMIKHSSEDRVCEEKKNSVMTDGPIPI